MKIVIALISFVVIYCLRGYFWRKDKQLMKGLNTLRFCLTTTGAFASDIAAQPLRRLGAVVSKIVIADNRK